MKTRKKLNGAKHSARVKASRRKLAKEGSDAVRVNSARKMCARQDGRLSWHETETGYLATLGASGVLFSVEPCEGGWSARYSADAGKTWGKPLVRETSEEAKALCEARVSSAPKAKTVHKAGHVRSDGAVSPICAKKPRALDLRRETWTNREAAVTCEACKAELESR